MIETQNEDMDGANTFYHFGDHRQDFDPVIQSYIKPPFHVAVNASLSFGIAGDATGVPFHFHGAVFAEVIYGRKHWFLYQPDYKPSFEPDTTSLLWYKNVYPFLKEWDKPLECSVLPYQIIYIPSNWYHSTLNIGQTVFISTFI